MNVTVNKIDIVFALMKLTFSLDCYTPKANSNVVVYQTSEVLYNRF